MSDTSKSMEKIVLSMGIGFLTIVGLFFFVIFNTLVGAIAGWIVGLFFGDTILGILAQLGVKGVTMWQFGAFLGFIGGFLKTKTTVIKSKLSDD